MHHTRTLLFVVGTRPEAIKMAPLIREFQKHPDQFVTRVCVTGQHREMLDQVLSFFSISPDYDLHLMKRNQDLNTLTADILTALPSVLRDCSPRGIWVQGDTTTVMAGALAAFHERVPLFHLEAGLRSGNRQAPFPEEINRTIASHLADFHFAPTRCAVRNLAAEGITRNVWQVGNTVIDALFLGLDIVRKQGEEHFFRYFDRLDFARRIVLVTAHRRESFGQALADICAAIKTIARQYADVEIVYPVHLNPRVQQVVRATLGGINNVHLLAPLDYGHLIWLMNRSFLVLTDSGGIQEEAPSLGKPVLVMRDVTERKEGIDAGTARLVGTDRAAIVNNARLLLDDADQYDTMANAVNPYGTGTTSATIVRLCREHGCFA